MELAPGGDAQYTDGGTVASIKPCNLRRLADGSAWLSHITNLNTTMSFFSASKNYAENGSRTRCLRAKEWKPDSKMQSDARIARVRCDAMISFGDGRPTLNTKGIHD